MVGDKKSVMAQKCLLKNAEINSAFFFSICEKFNCLQTAFIIIKNNNPATFVFLLHKKRESEVTDCISYYSKFNRYSFCLCTG